MEALRNLIKKVEEDRLVSNRNPKPRKEGEPNITTAANDKRANMTIDSQGSDSHGLGLIDRL